MLGKRKRSSSDGAKNKDDRNDELHQKVEKLQKSVDENNQKQKEEIEKILGELQKLNKSKKTEESDAEKKQSFNSVISPGSLMKNTPSNGMPPVGRSFVLKNVFENISKLKENKRLFSEEEDYFGVNWCMSIDRKDEHYGFHLMCTMPFNNGKWAIDTDYILKMTGVNGKTTSAEIQGIIGNPDGSKRPIMWGKKKFITLEELKKEYLVDDKLTAEVHVKINKMTGVYEEKSKQFDESAKEFSDVILKIDDEKFYVSKLFLSFRSTYFKSLFLGNFKESSQSEIKLSGIAAEDFQKFLEVLYGDSLIDETTVEGILLVADMYDTSIVVEKCEAFLMRSNKSNRKKLQMAIRYNLDKLKKKCLSDIESVDDIKSMISGNIKDLDRSIMAELLEKSISLQ